VLRTLLLDLGRAPPQGLVRAVDAEREPGIRQGVLMPAIEERVVGQLPELAQGGPHVGHRAFEHAAATQGEQRVRREKELLAREPVGDMPHRVAGGVDDLGLERPHEHATPGLDEIVHGRDAVRVGLRGNDAAAGGRFERLDSLDVVLMVVGDEDLRQTPAPAGKGGLDGRGFRRVDGGRATGLRIVEEHAEIVGTAQEQLCLGSHGSASLEVGPF
jgi:hypothetical protein